MARNIATMLGYDVPSAPAGTGPADPVTIPLDQLHEDETNPRRHFDPDALNQLAASLKEQGLMQPLLVTPINEQSYLVVDGARRYRAAQIAGLAAVPVYVRNFRSRGELVAARVTANVVRNGFTPGEEAHAYLEAIREIVPDPGEPTVDRRDDGLPARATTVDGALVDGYITNRGFSRRTGIPSRRIDRALSLLRHKDLLARVEAETLSYAEALDTIGVRNEETKRRARAAAVIAADDAALPSTDAVLRPAFTPDPASPPTTDAALDTLIAAATTAAQAVPLAPTISVNAEADQIERYNRTWKPVIQLNKWASRVDPASVPPSERKEWRAGLEQARQVLADLIARFQD